MSAGRGLAGLGIALFLSACQGQQSALSGGGAESDRTLALTVLLGIGGAIIFLLVSGALLIALRGPRRWRSFLSAHTLVVHGGITFPAVVLSLLMIYSFAVLRAGPVPESDPDEPSHVIRVEGLQWWWRVTYVQPDGSEIEAANEIRIPVGEPVRLELISADVIHSLWIPAYAGKLDMIPGHTNMLTLLASEPGTVRGQCAEYCGGAHALMALSVTAVLPPSYERWLAGQAEPAHAEETTGQRAFLSAGCGGCHTIRGSSARGRVGPDLTHLASRPSLGAGTLENDAEGLARWLDDHHQVKPDNLMPDYDFLPASEQAEIVTYLSELE
tara:strand:+ start:3206 stop:4189 length:984 start_codon:yes stop_codon:yes gene_type:complete